MNIMQPNKQCMSCKYWVPASTSRWLGYTVGGYCKPGYCKKRSINSTLCVVQFTILCFLWIDFAAFIYIYYAYYN